MDQNSTNGTDKRNWRERLGIGSKEMPRISEEFQPAPAAPRAATVKPAPMAPRAAPRPVAPAPASRPFTQSAGPIDQDALASKLKSQRDAAEKLAEQRVQAARQRAEAAILVQPSAPQIANSAAKPKFSFAEEAPRGVAPVAQQRLQQTQVPQQQQRAPALPPARPQLGAGVPPRSAPPQYQPRQPIAPPPANYKPTYNANQGYRPIDPATGYPPAPQYNQGQGYAPQPRQSYAPQQPRLQVPARQGQDYGYGYEGQRGAQRLGAPNTGRGPALQNYADNEQDDIFEQAPVRGQRRATVGDYQQAYREVESGYEDEIPRARGPGILLALLALALVVGFGSVWAYNNYIKPQTSIASGDKVPVVKAQDAPAKVSGDGTAGDPATNNNQTAAPSKKQIYDRIVGDREVLGGQIVPTEETPVQPLNNSQPIPEPAGDIPLQPSGTGDDGTPLPLPPPPGDGGGQQGSLEPSGKTDQQTANINPAAGASQAAELPFGAAALPLPEAPVPGEQIASATPDPAPLLEPPAPSSQVAIETAPEVKPEAIANKIVAPKPPEEKKVVVAKPAKSLGVKPVVLVAPVKVPVANKTPDVADATPIDGSSLYGDTALGEGLNTAPAPQVETVVVKKKKSLFDLFKGETKAAENNVALNEPVAQAQPELLPPVQQVAPVSKAFVAQLASFKSKAEATQEYRNLSAKHGPIISRYAPIVTQAQVAGTTRYRLSIGPMATQSVASSVCQSLFAAGQRDCLVNRQ